MPMISRYAALAATCVFVLNTALAVAEDSSTARYRDSSPGSDWPGYGRTYGEGHYSPLDEIDTGNVGRLGLAWSLELGQENSVTQPIAVDGVLYFATGYSIVQAVDAKTGKRLWSYDPNAAEAAGINLRLGWGSRGISWWNGKIYTATHDGRLIAIDARDGKPVWTAQTLDRRDALYISAAPRVFDGKVIIGNASDYGAVRGYVTAYDAETGQQLWRFHTVPGDPADGFENDAMAMAAKTWFGEWWKHGGGGTVWNSIAYDPDTDTLFLGTGNGYPWNRRARSAGQGDNLFLCSIVALSGATGDYKWHYQINPGETWDYNAAMDVQLAELPIDGKPRKVVMNAPKNGFFYVLDRETGQLISAEPFAKVNWASRIDLATGRPVENPAARYPDGTTAEVWPSSQGAHGWLPMAYSPKRQRVFIPVMEQGMTITDAGVDVANWRAPLDRTVFSAVHTGADIDDPLHGTGALVAWDPVAQKAVWRVPHPTHVNGGVMATAGDLVFQGTVAGDFTAYAADDGRVLWSFPAQAPVHAPPLSYAADGRQYVTVLTGLGTSAGSAGPAIARYDINPRTQARRVLTFVLDGRAQLPPRTLNPDTLRPPTDPGFAPDVELARIGAAVYLKHCTWCHGAAAIGAGHSPDLRRSAVPLGAEAFARVVRDGELVANGMPRFEELTDEALAALRQYLRTEAAALRASGTRR